MRIILAVINKELRRYRWSIAELIRDLLLLYLVFLVLISMVEHVFKSYIDRETLVIAFSVWAFLILNYFDAFAILMHEIKTGAFLRLSSSRRGFSMIIGLQILLAILKNLLIAGIMFIALAFASGWFIPSKLGACLLIAVSLVPAVIGLSFLTAGLDLLIGSARYVMQIITFFLVSLVVVPLEHSLFVSTFPVVQGMWLIRKLVFDGYSLYNLIDSNLLQYLGISIGYLIIGVLVHRFCCRKYYALN